MRSSQLSSMPLEPRTAALADGAVRGRRARRVEAALADRPDLLDSLDRQRRAVAVMRELSPAMPPRLRTRLEEERRRTGRYLGRRFP